LTSQIRDFTAGISFRARLATSIAAVGFRGEIGRLAGKTTSNPLGFEVVTDFVEAKPG